MCKLFENNFNKMHFIILFQVLITLQILCPYPAQATPTPTDHNVYSPPEEPNAYELPGKCADEDKSFCTIKGDNYPEDKIAELVKSIDKTLPGTPRYNIGSRTNAVEELEDSDCPSNHTNEPVYYIIDENDEVRVVVQHPGKFMQLYDIKWCQNEGRITKTTAHFTKDSNTLKNYDIECVNTKMQYDFFVLNEDSEELKMVAAQAKGGIPVCCRCRYNGVKPKK